MTLNVSFNVKGLSELTLLFVICHWWRQLSSCWNTWLWWCLYHIGYTQLTAFWVPAGTRTDLTCERLTRESTSFNLVISDITVSTIWQISTNRMTPPKGLVTVWRTCIWEYNRMTCDEHGKSHKHLVFMTQRHTGDNDWLAKCNRHSCVLTTGMMRNNTASYVHYDIIVIHTTNGAALLQ